MIALLAALAQIAITAMVPLPVMPIVADDYARFAAEFGPDAKICTTGTEAPGKRAPPHDDPASGRMPDCSICPVCGTLRHIAAFVLLVPDPIIPARPLAAAAQDPRETDHVAAHPISAPRPRAPPALT
jgi:DUF2946 family protein